VNLGICISKLLLSVDVSFLLAESLVIVKFNIKFMSLTRLCMHMKESRHPSFCNRTYTQFDGS